jgi:hypothetical protein
VPAELVTTIQMPIVIDPVIKDTGHSMTVRWVAVSPSAAVALFLAP